MSKIEVLGKRGTERSEMVLSEVLIFTKAMTALGVNSSRGFTQKTLQMAFINKAVRKSMFEWFSYYLS